MDTFVNVTIELNKLIVLSPFKAKALPVLFKFPIKVELGLPKNKELLKTLIRVAVLKSIVPPNTTLLLFSILKGF